jgi:CRP-like cAMP-binding protein
LIPITLAFQPPIDYDLDHMSEFLPFPLSTLPDATLRSVDLDKNQSLFRQQDPANAIFYIVSGSVELHRVTKDGTSVLIHRATAGTCLAEAALFASNYHCDAIATQPTQVISMAKPAILAAMRDGSTFAPQMMELLAHQVQNLRQKVTILAIRSAQDRVVAALANGFMIKSVPSFASEIGLTPEATYRALTKATKAGQIVKIGRGRYRVVATNMRPDA